MFHGVALFVKEFIIFAILYKMKIAITYPPLDIGKGIPQLSQNRQFQWTTSGPVAYFIYPVILASAATLLKKNNHQVAWLDGLAEKWTFDKWLEEIDKFKPELIAIESKTPVIKLHWKIIDKLKSLYPKTFIVLMGDHVTALPKESFQNSPVDFIVTGGDYDFSLLNLVNYLENKEDLDPRILPSEKNKLKTSGRKQISKKEFYYDLDTLPVIDRDLTRWSLYAYKNTNFYRAPGAYTMFGRDCWWGKCTFCSWTTLFPGQRYRVVSVKNAVREIKNLVENYHVQEIMDDSGTFPVGDWLREFCREIIKLGYQNKIRINCNMRFKSGLNQEDYDLMRKAGFRFILYGLESANQLTLNKINKNLAVEEIEPNLRMAKKAGLWPHLTVMIGYPWETEKEITKTTQMVESLFNKGLVDSMQATIVIPYPGTPLFTWCQKHKVLKTQDWDRFDMREPIIRTKISDEKLLGYIRDLYSRSIWNPRFIAKTFIQMATFDGFKYVSFQAMKYLGKLWEFK